MNKIPPLKEQYNAIVWIVEDALDKQLQDNLQLKNLSVTIKDVAIRNGRLILVIGERL